MKASAKKSHQGTDAPTLIRTTFIIPDTLDQNIEVLCAMNRLNKTEVVRTALSEFLMKHGLNPDKKPKLIQY